MENSAADTCSARGHFERLKKYHSRGIEIINPPNGALALAEDPWNMCMDDFG